MITLRRSDDRGFFDHGWLQTRHSFSFADYYDEAHMGFGALRVINEDRVQPGQGFGRHGHRDMEILSWVLDGALVHRDSTGGATLLRPGEVQRMSAGTGVWHSEANGSAEAPVHFLQIWILPDRAGHEPSYEQRSIPEASRRGRLALLASPDGAQGSTIIHQDARVFVGELALGQRAEVPLAPGRRAWVQLARGALSVNGMSLRPGDGAALTGEARVALAGESPLAEVLVFDLA